MSVVQVKLIFMEIVFLLGFPMNDSVFSAKESTMFHLSETVGIVIIFPTSCVSYSSAVACTLHIS